MAKENINLKEDIKVAINNFSKENLTENCVKLFEKLGYNTERQTFFDEKTYQYFKEYYINEKKDFNETKALTNEWKYADLLFQITKDEVTFERKLFKENKINNSIIESYLFFTIELTKDEYSRTALSQITREINKVFLIPLLVVFKYGNKITLAVIHRRVNKKEQTKDVLEKVTLIKDININAPHRAHIEILFDLSFEQIKTKYQITNFIDLHNSWQEILDLKELNKKFYKELSNWYFWAIENVNYPDDVKDENSNSQNVIRLLTRLIFIWFIKEKQLIPEVIFNKEELNKIIKGFNENNSTVYYRTILQNLFFATLNQKIEEREFAIEGDFNQNKINYSIKNLYRYANDFLISKEEVKKLFENVPFLNGGLFDCLDYMNDEGKVIYIDGFSRNSKKQANIPDELFFIKEKIIEIKDLSEDEKKKKTEKVTVKGLFEIFNHYKFTIEENTPIEEEIALDPELLGRVFENLLASYNPETKTTARKQTGSFYTPREIVNYMVDESLKEYLKQKLIEEKERNFKGQTNNGKNPKGQMPLVDGTTDNQLMKNNEHQLIEKENSQEKNPKGQMPLVVGTIENQLIENSQEETFEPTFFVTFATHNSRIGQRMMNFHVYPENPVIFDVEDEILVSKLLLNIVEEYKYKIIKYNICKDHIHLILICKENKRDDIIRLIKSKITLFYKKEHKITEELHLWTQKYYWKIIQDSEGLNNVSNYIKTNRKKHYLPENAILNELIQKINQAGINNSKEQNPKGQMPLEVGTTENQLMKNNEHQLIEKENSQEKNPKGQMPLINGTTENQLMKNNEHQLIEKENPNEHQLIEKEIEENLNDLFEYNNNINPFDKDDTDILITAIDNCKILDPACGSGAFPMGILQKLVFILHKLDPKNELWKEKQIQKVDDLINKVDIDDSNVRDKIISELEANKKDIEESFSHNELDYGRKLYLIENCIYGVDIQPIAIQISKLRFFISLIINQTTNNNKKDNYGVRPLPNLETKFVTANTLIGIEKPQIDKLSFDKEFKELEDKLKDVRHRLFSVKDRTNKLKLQTKEKQLRNQIALKLKETLIEDNKEKTKELNDKITAFKNKLDEIKPIWEIVKKNGLFGNIEEKKVDKSKEEKQKIKNSLKESEDNLKKLKDVKLDDVVLQLASWNPYDQNATSSFFDPEWMFGIKEGFDIVIGNPPYINVENIDIIIKDNIKNFKTAFQKYDMYVLFYELGISLLKDKGILNFITSNKFFSQGYGLLLRKLFLNFTIQQIINFNYDIFETATVRTCIFQLLKTNRNNNFIKIIDVQKKEDIDKFINNKFSFIEQKIFNDLEENNFRITLTTQKIELLKKIEFNTLRIDDICSVNYGLRPSSEKLELKKDSFIKENNPDNIYKKYFEGKDMGYWTIMTSSYLDYQPEVMYNAMFTELFEYEKIVGLRTLSDIGKLRFIYDDDGYYCNDSVVILTLWYKFENIKNKTIERLITKEKIQLSKKYNIKYLQSILNSKIIKFYVNELFYDGTHFYPNHMKQLPIPQISDAEQLPFVTLVDYILFLKENESKKIDKYVDNSHIAQNFEKLIDTMVVELYFKEDVEKENLEIIKHVQKDFKAITPTDDFDKKAKIILDSYELLNERNNIIRNNLLLLPIKLSYVYDELNKV